MFIAFCLGCLVLGLEPRSHAGYTRYPYGTGLALDIYHPMGRRCGRVDCVAGRRQIESPWRGLGRQRIFDRFCGLARLEDVVFITAAIDKLRPSAAQPHG